MKLSDLTTYQSGLVQATAYRRLNQHFTAILERHDLTCMQWFVLGTIYDAGEAGIRVTELAERVGTGLPFLTNLINLLESKELVARTVHEHDNRSKLVAVTPTFRAACPAIEEELRQELRTSLYAHLTPEELRIYVAVLYKLAALEIK